jgi:predicted RND superfamily exporter protein
MKSNEGMTDRVIRMFLGVAIAMYFVFHNSPWALVGLIPFVTGVVGFCPLYSILGINTNKPEQA